MDKSEKRPPHLVSENKCSVEYFCEMCDFYPLYPAHGHYECPKCHYKTKCCEGLPQDLS